MGHIKIRYPLALVLIALVCGGCNALKRTAYEGFDRNEWQHPEEVIRSLGLQAGGKVADLGSGSGYFTVRLASAVGSTGKVYAVDVDREMNDYVVKRAQEEGYNNVEVILAKYDDPLLPGSGVDLIFTCNTYHHLENRVQYFANVRKHLRPNGRVAIVDFNGEGWFQKIFGHWTAGEVIQKEMEEAGYVLQREFTFLPKQFFLVFSTQAS